MHETDNHTLQTMDAEYQRIKNAFSERSVQSFSDKDLVDALLVLAANRTDDDSVYVQDGIQAMSINHLILQRIIIGVERRSRTTANVVIFLAVVSVVASIVQIYLSLI